MIGINLDEDLMGFSSVLGIAAEAGPQGRYIRLGEGAAMGGVDLRENPVGEQMGLGPGYSTVTVCIDNGKQQAQGQRDTGGRHGWGAGEKRDQRKQASGEGGRTTARQHELPSNWAPAPINVHSLAQYGRPTSSMVIF